MWEMVTNKNAVSRGGYATLFGYNDHSYMRIVPEVKERTYSRGRVIVTPDVV
jgi:hypothetical protein